MADILIRGFEMPTNGFDCPLNTFGFCNLAQDETHYECVGDSRPKWCPLVPLPEGHGRLVDARKLYDKLQETLTHYCKVKSREYTQFYDVGYFDAWNDALAVLTNAPTIVPAEGGKADD